MPGMKALRRSARATLSAARTARRLRALRIPLDAPFPEDAYRSVADTFAMHVGRRIASVLDVGANFGQCASFLATRHAIPPEEVVCVEAHPDLAAYLTTHHSFTVVNGAVGLLEDERVFFARHVTPDRTRMRDALRGRVTTNNRPGMSSLLVHQQDGNADVAEVRVPGIRLSSLIHERGRGFDFAKIDVEGAALEALQSLGPSIDAIGSIHIEAETRQIWAGQALWPEISAHLERAGFEMVLYRLDRHFLQCESFWIRRSWIRSFLDA